MILEDRIEWENKGMRIRNTAGNQIGQQMDRLLHDELAVLLFAHFGYEIYVGDVERYIIQVCDGKK